MKISAINESVSLIANIGVIGSIVFLGLEMQQNTEMMQSQTRNSIVENQLSFYERGIENNDFAEVIAEKRLDPSLYPFEIARRGFQYALFVASLLRMWENEFYQYQIGLFDQMSLKRGRIYGNGDQCPSELRKHGEERKICMLQTFEII